MRPYGLLTGKAVFRAAILCGLMGHALLAQHVVRIDATLPVASPQPITAQMGANRNPDGKVIGVNSQYLTMDGKPWLPVMGEFHFSRYPQAEWEEEILKMKAAGIDILSTYVIWIHHEQNEGEFNWSGQRDLRRFVELCGKHGMYVYPRVGPWAHAETRNGGLPDWVLKNSPTRQNDPVYLKEVGSFYAQIAKQLNGLLWKDGGPVIGVQIENEYHEKGAGKGPEHIRTLKQMAVADGLDVPLYTVTGWDGAAIPLDAVLPVFGGYPDAPWDGSPKALPPNEVYAFRFGNRAAGSMGAIGGGGQNAASTYRGTPFLTVEVGAGIEDTYFRRPVVSADDVAAIAPVMLGSGVNLLGYYMFHGGRNPEGGAITLQESQRTGYPTDVPVKSYDFQAPLGEFGQERESLRKLKLVHYFLSDFGAQLAPMEPRAPSEMPANPADMGMPRIAARTLGDQGFVFFNNHVRGVNMPAQAGFQVELKLPSETLRVPETPVTLPSDGYGIWPVNLDLEGARLRYGTAQLFKRVVTLGRTYYFFFAVPGVQPEFMFDSAVAIGDLPPGVERTATRVGIRLRMNGDFQTEIDLPGKVSLVLLPEPEAEKIWRGDDPTMLLATKADVFANGAEWTLQSTGDASFKFALFGTQTAPSLHGKLLSVQTHDALFTTYAAAVPEIHLPLKINSGHADSPRSPWQMGPKLSWRPVAIPLAPDDPDFKGATSWKITLPAIPSGTSLADVLLRIRYQGDAARLSRENELLDDNFWNGLPWEVGLREAEGDWHRPQNAMQLRVLPLPQKFPMYLEEAAKLRFVDGVAEGLEGIELVPRYQIQVRMTSTR